MAAGVWFHAGHRKVPWLHVKRRAHSEQEMVLERLHGIVRARTGVPHCVAPRPSATSFSPGLKSSRVIIFLRPPRSVQAGREGLHLRGTSVALKATYLGNGCGRLSPLS